jgi:hypothetical protein
MLTSRRCPPSHLPHLPRPSSVAASGHDWMPMAGRTVAAPMPSRTIKVPMARRTRKVPVASPAMEVTTAGRTMENGPYLGQTQRIITAAKASATVTVTVTITVTSGSPAWSPDPTTRESSCPSLPGGRDRAGAVRRSTIGV